MTATSMEVTDDDLPALFRAADRASASAQRLYLYLVGTDLIVMIMGAVLGALSVSSDGVKHGLAVASAVSMATGLAITLAIKSQRLAATWYNGRAVAESVKTSAWRYMVGAEPYGLSLEVRVADKRFTNALDAFLLERKELASSLPAALMSAESITKRMRRARGMPLSERMKLYMSSRVGSQRQWYAEKAEQNEHSARLFLSLVLVSQGLALIAAIAIIQWIDAPVNLTGVFSAVAAAIIAWTQLRKNQDLATAYGLAAQELSSIETQGHYVEDDAAFSAFVLNAENAISREHTLWLARLDRY